jgi:hypothetical protein
VRRIAVVIGLLVVPSVAHAICGRTPPMFVSPHRGVAVPTNAQLVLSAPVTWRGDSKLTLVTAPGQRHTAVALTERAWITGKIQRFELLPSAPLSPSTAYELRTTRGEIVAVFTTSVLADTRPPTWTGVRSGVVRRFDPRVIGLECGSPEITLSGESAASDDQTTRDDIRYAAWFGKPSTPIDYTAPPVTWTRASPDIRFSLQFGNTEDSDFDLPPQRPLRIGVKAVDFAGNASAPSELTLD